MPLTSEQKSEIKAFLSLTFFEPLTGNEKLLGETRERCLYQAYWYVLFQNKETFRWNISEIEEFEEFINDIFPFVNTTIINEYTIGEGLNQKRSFFQVPQNIAKLNLGKSCMEKDQLPSGQDVNEYIKQLIIDAMDPRAFNLDIFIMIGKSHGVEEEFIEKIAEFLKKTINEKRNNFSASPTEKEEEASKEEVFCLEQLLYYAHKNDVDAACELGRLLLEKKNYENAVPWLKRAFELGDIDAFNCLEQLWNKHGGVRYYLDALYYPGNGISALSKLKKLTRDIKLELESVKLGTSSFFHKTKNLTDILSKVYLMLGVQYLKASHFTSAIKYFENAAIYDCKISFNFLASLASDKYNYPDAAIAIALIYSLDKSGLDKSISYYGRAIELYEKQLKGCSSSIAIDIQIKIGNIYRKLSEINPNKEDDYLLRAIQHYELGGEIALNICNKMYKDEAYQEKIFKVGMIYYECHKLLIDDRKYKYLQKVITLWQSIFDFPAQNSLSCEAQCILGLIYNSFYEQTKDKNDFSMMLKYFIFTLNYNDGVTSVYTRNQLALLAFIARVLMLTEMRIGPQDIIKETQDIIRFLKVSNVSAIIGEHLSFADLAFFLNQIGGDFVFAKQLFNEPLFLELIKDGRLRLSEIVEYHKEEKETYELNLIESIKSLSKFPIILKFVKKGTIGLNSIMIRGGGSVIERMEAVYGSPEILKFLTATNVTLDEVVEVYHEEVSVIIMDQLITTLNKCPAILELIKKGQLTLHNIMKYHVMNPWRFSIELIEILNECPEIYELIKSNQLTLGMFESCYQRIENRTLVKLMKSLSKSPSILELIRRGQLKLDNLVEYLVIKYRDSGDFSDIESMDLAFLHVSSQPTLETIVPDTSSENSSLMKFLNEEDYDDDIHAEVGCEKIFQRQNKKLHNYNYHFYKDVLNEINRINKSSYGSQELKHDKLEILGFLKTCVEKINPTFLSRMIKDIAKCEIRNLNLVIREINNEFDFELKTIKFQRKYKVNDTVYTLLEIHRHRCESLRFFNFFQTSSTQLLDKYSTPVYEEMYFKVNQTLPTKLRKLG